VISSDVNKAKKSMTRFQFTRHQDTIFKPRSCWPSKTKDGLHQPVLSLNMYLMMINTVHYCNDNKVEINC